jgi:hypothetical protein
MRPCSSILARSDELPYPRRNALEQTIRQLLFYFLHRIPAQTGKQGAHAAGNIKADATG